LNNGESKLKQQVPNNRNENLEIYLQTHSYLYFAFLLPTKVLKTLLTNQRSPYSARSSLERRAYRIPDRGRGQIIQAII
jgi:hypothetical protein